MNTPGINIFFENGALGQVQASADGVFGLLATANTVASTFVLQTPYVLRKLDDLKTLGVTAANNAAFYKVVSEFYAQAGDGTELWVMGFANTVTQTQMLDVTDELRGRALVEAANGRLRALFTSFTPVANTAVIAQNGLDMDVTTARQNAQALAVWATETKAAPLFVIISGTYYTGNPVDLADLTMESFNRVGVLVGDTVAGNGAAIGLLAGRLASTPVQRNAGRVLDGPVASLSIFLKDKPLQKADWESVHQKGYLTFRTHVERAGFYFVDDPLATLPTDDYNHITARRTIDKARRISYSTILQKMLSEVPVTIDGTIQPGIAKGWEADVETAIATAMTAAGELSADATDPNDRGVICKIDTTNKLSSTGKVAVSVRVRPFGYARFFDIYLGFQVVNP